MFIMSSAMIVTAAVLEIGKKGETVAWNLLFHHLAITAISLFALDRLIWAIADYLATANDVEFLSFLTTENIFEKLSDKQQADVELIIKYAQLQVVGTALEIPTILARLHHRVKVYAAKYEPSWQVQSSNARRLLIPKIHFVTGASSSSCVCAAGEFRVLGACQSGARACAEHLFPR